TGSSIIHKRKAGMTGISKMTVIFVMISMFTACTESASQKLLGKWSGVDRNDNRQVFIFHGNDTATWIIAETGTLKVRYRFDPGSSPFHLDLMGFVGPPLEDKTLFGIAEFADPNSLKFDCEAGPSGEDGADFRPVSFTDDTVVYRRID
ncbi:MAG: hypothetical protein MJD61_09190, partial [Proteobacteria bacterium]|nr:hypothetical protein [Pseudomonadota bacterium]